MRIAHLWYVAPIFGGAESWAIGFSKALRKLGVESEIVCWRTEGSSKHRDFFRILGGNVPDKPDVIDVLMNGVFMAEHLQDYDLICPHHMITLFPAVFSKSLHGNQVACILHSPPMEWKLSAEGLVSYRKVSEKSQWMYTIWKMMFPYSDFFFTNSIWNRGLYEKYEGVSPIPLLAGVDHEVFKPDISLREEFREKLKVDEETILLFYSSAAGRRKRHELLLRSLRILVNRGYKVKCILTCSKDRRTRGFHPLVGRIIKKLGLEDRVLAFPAADEEVLLGLYNACDIYVHPANNEHLGMAILEAMAVGKPVIAQANGGVPEIVKDGIEGFLFKSDNLYHLTECIERLIVDEELRNTMGRKTLKRVKYFDWLEVARRFLQVTS